MKLAAWLSERKISQAAFAEMIGSSQSQVARFAADARIPNRPTMLRIVEVTDGAVGPNDFYDASADPTTTEPSEAA